MLGSVSLKTAQNFTKRIFGFSLKRMRHSCGLKDPCMKGEEDEDPMKVTLSDGRRMPIIGLGTFQIPTDKLENCVEHAIDIGYRHIDCAYAYENEIYIGAAIRAKLKDQTVKRQDLWITSKLWNTFHQPYSVCKACELTLNHLGLDYLDLYLMHWPMGYKEDWKKTYLIKDTDKIVFDEVHYLDTWQAMEYLVKEGYCKSIGVANFNKCQLGRVLEITKTPLVVNQIECHPYLNQSPLRTYCKEKKVVNVAYAPLGSPANPWIKPDDPNLLDNDEVKCIATNHKKTPAQVLIRYQLQLGTVPIPKSGCEERITQNFQVFDFELCDEEVEKLNCLNKNHRYVAFANAKKHLHYPFNDDY